ncbi:hypothetical protein [Ralstonia insidiosa]|uniref:Uncharacterized protein n=1 Tax=Ralstonia insidiosa TaxID=190721 RepID=A0A848NV66_9RALS|nr:hypothetical protein [Ralstonia insidiosa]NMV37239.1 hypothetical protein [Ralstonia insidiosa]
MAEKQYRVNWALSGVGKKDLKEGDSVKMDEDEAAHLVKLGVLTPADAKSAAPEGGGE